MQVKHSGHCGKTDTGVIAQTEGRASMDLSWGMTAGSEWTYYFRTT